jgi:hypothetical protein
VRPGTAAFGPGPLRQPAGDIPPMEKATTLRLTLLRLALGNTTYAFSAVPTLPQCGSWRAVPSQLWGEGQVLWLETQGRFGYTLL